MTVWIVGVWFLLAVAAAVAGYMVGAAKGRPGVGLLLGLLFSVAGVLLVAVLPPSEEELRRRDRHQRVRDADLAAAIAASTSSAPSPVDRQKLIAEAIRRDPSLGADDHPETLKRLADSMAEIAEEAEIRSDLEALRTAHERERVAADRQQREMEALAARRAAERRATEAERAERLAHVAAMHPVHRWVNGHRGLLVVILCVAAVGVLGSFAKASNDRTVAAELATQRTVAAQATERAKEKAANEAANEAALTKLKAACDLGQAGEPSTDPEGLSAWSTCSEPAVRAAVAANASTPPDALLVLAGDPKESVRVALAGRESPDQGVFRVVAKDSSPQVRRGLARNPWIALDVQMALSGDPNASVRRALTRNPNVTSLVLRRLVRDSARRVAEAAAIARRAT